MNTPPSLWTNLLLMDGNYPELVATPGYSKSLLLKISLFRGEEPGAASMSLLVFKLSSSLLSAAHTNNMIADGTYPLPPLERGFIGFVGLMGLVAES